MIFSMVYIEPPHGIENDLEIDLDTIPKREQFNTIRLNTSISPLHFILTSFFPSPCEPIPIRNLLACSHRRVV